ncbi:MAG: hypothetical protein IPP29_13595 [Bacteroidetes bacterium]|nr:hypothetical protein [Bacteroidota bacterium]
MTALVLLYGKIPLGDSYQDYLNSITPTPDGGYVLGGGSSSNISGDKTENSNGTYDYWVVKIDSLGAIVWQNTIGGNSNDELSSITPSPDGGYVLGGYSYSNISGDKTENSNGSYDYWVVKIDSLGAIVWQNTIGGSSDDNYIPLLPRPMEITFWEDCHCQISLVTKPKIAMVSMIIG